jgi:error-prone DNA polymerase
MICRADTMGVFQIESRAQMSMLPRLKPRTFYDLVIEVALVRPGPIQGNMVHPYLRRRAGEEQPEYPNEAIRDVLHKTLGVPLFQEQAMRLAVVAAGFTPGEADQLRRAMGAWRRPGIIEQFHQRLVEGMLARGLSAEFAEQVFRQIRGFGEYGFPESHAASFALLVYVSAWLKCYYPAAFAAALLNSQPMGFYAPAQLVRNAREHGVEVRPVDVNRSEWDCSLECGMRNAECGTEDANDCKLQNAKCKVQIEEERQPASGLNVGEQLELSAEPECKMQSAKCKVQNEMPRLDPPRPPAADAASIDNLQFAICNLQSSGVHDSATNHPIPPALRLGFRQIVGFSEAHARAIEQARRDGPFRSLGDFARRTGLSRAVIARLAEADAFGSLEKNRRSALWHALAQEKQSHALPLFAGVEETDEADVELPQLAEQEEVVADYRTAGLSLRAHPMQFHRDLLNELRVTPAIALAELPNDRFVRVAGLVLVRQRPGTAKGITFVTLEDETGTANLIIRQNIWERFYRAARTAVALIAHGRLQIKDEVIHVLVSRLEDLSDRLPSLRSQSRDFQ